MSFSFSGNVSNYLELVDALSQNSRQGPWTFACKVRMTATDDNVALSYGNGAASNQYIAVQVTDNGGVDRSVLFFDRNNTWEFPQTSDGFASDTWVSIVCTIDPTTPTRTVTHDNGSLGTNSNSLANTTNNTRIRIGQTADSSPQFPFNGLIADICIWSSVLSAGDQTDYAVNNIDPSTISPSTLDFHVSGRVDDANLLLNTGTEGGTLTEGGTVPFDSDNPPALSAPLSVSPPLVAGGAVYEPAVLQVAAPQFIDSGEVYEPTATTSSIAAPDLVDGGAVYEPGVLQTAGVQFVDGGAVYEPTIDLEQSQTVAVPLVSGGTVYQPDSVGNGLMAQDLLDQTFTTRDGETIEYDVYLPDLPTSVPAPVIVWSESLTTVRDNWRTWVEETWRDAGFVAILLDTRGRGGSSGTHDLGGFGARDIVDCLDEVLADHSEYCSGDHYVGGGSGSGYKAVMTALKFPDRFKACINFYAYALSFGFNDTDTASYPDYDNPPFTDSYEDGESEWWGDSVSRSFIQSHSLRGWITGDSSGTPYDYPTHYKSRDCKWLGPYNLYSPLWTRVDPGSDEPERYQWFFDALTAYARSTAYPTIDTDLNAVGPPALSHNFSPPSIYADAAVAFCEANTDAIVIPLSGEPMRIADFLVTNLFSIYLQDPDSSTFSELGRTAECDYEVIQNESGENVTVRLPIDGDAVDATFDGYFVFKGLVPSTTYDRIREGSSQGTASSDSNGELVWDAVSLSGTGEIMIELATAQVVSPDAVTGGDVYQPSAFLENIASPDDVVAGGDVYEPQVLQTAVVDFVDGGAVYAPGVHQTAAPQEVDGGAVYAPTVFIGSFLDIPLVDGGAVYAPGVLQTAGVQLVSGGAVYAPTVAIGPVIVDAEIANLRGRSSTISLMAE